jgi:hypothetical protein
MAKQGKYWVFGTPRRSLRGTVMDEVDTKAGELIEGVLKPKHVKPPPTGHQLNYITPALVHTHFRQPSSQSLQGWNTSATPSSPCHS